MTSSAPGQNTPIFLFNDPSNSSETDLVAVNTFTGNVELDHGYLGINSDANLGNPTNRLTLAVGTTTTGGLVFLNGGINMAGR